MDIPYLISLLQNKINYLNNARSSAAAVGDVSGVSSIDQDILTTQNTLAQLELLQQMNQAASNAGTTTSEIVSIGLYSLQNTVQGPNAGAIINGYDISAYATDPQYESKIQTILAKQPQFASAMVIDTYIQGLYPGSPVTGAMVMAALVLYPVDVQLFMAIMELDSRFGTQGVGARTNNPGNIGNTGTATYSFPSWNDGVTGVAEWLNRHRAGATTTSTTTTDATSTAATSTTPVVPMSQATPAALAAVAAAQNAANQASGATLSTVASSTTSTSSPGLSDTSTSTSATSTPTTSASSTPTTFATSTDTTATSTASSATSTAPVDAATSSAATSTDSNYGTSTAATN